MTTSKPTAQDFFEQTGERLMAIDLLLDSISILKNAGETEAQRDECQWLRGEKSSLVSAKQCFVTLGGSWIASAAPLRFIAHARENPEALKAALLVARSAIRRGEPFHCEPEGDNESQHEHTLMGVEMDDGIETQVSFQNTPGAH